MKHFPAKSTVIEVRKGQAPAPLERAQFSNRFRASFIDPAFRAEDQSIARLEEIAWIAYSEGRKAPFTRKAGPGYVDPDYDLSTEWLGTKQRIVDAHQIGEVGRSATHPGIVTPTRDTNPCAAVELRGGRDAPPQLLAFGGRGQLIARFSTVQPRSAAGASVLFEGDRVRARGPSFSQGLRTRGEPGAGGRADRRLCRLVGRGDRRHGHR